MAHVRDLLIVEGTGAGCTDRNKPPRRKVGVVRGIIWSLFDRSKFIVPFDEIICQSSEINRNVIKFISNAYIFPVFLLAHFCGIVKVMLRLFKDNCEGQRIDAIKDKLRFLLMLHDIIL